VKLSAPKQITWIIAVIFGIVGILATLVALPVITAEISFWLVVVGLALLLVATITRGL
jgi:hypothetical protein